MMYEEQRQSVVNALQELASSGLVIGTAGNVSLRLEENVFVMSPSTLPYAGMIAEDVVVVDSTGNVLEGDRNPTSEMQLHLAVYSTTSHTALVHTHSKAAVAVSTLVDALPPQHYYINQLGGHVSVAPYFTYGTRDLADAVSAAMGDRAAAIMANHGAVAGGLNLEEAMYRAGLVEWLSETWLLASSAGKPRVLTEDELRLARERRGRTIHEEIAGS
jgi:L-fuculose-phosphate aldolase